MSDEVPVPQVELTGSFIRITQFSKQQNSSVLIVPADSVDEFCESLYWARKQYLTNLNDASRAAEGEHPDYIPAIKDQKPKTIAQGQGA